jgi:hypothetical protein
MNTNQKIKELIKEYKDFQAKGNPKCSTWAVISDLETLLEPECKHENLKRVIGSQHGTILYKYNECKDCGKVFK